MLLLKTKVTEETRVPEERRPGLVEASPEANQERVLCRDAIDS